MECKIYVAAAHPKAAREPETNLNNLLNFIGRDPKKRSNTLSFANDWERMNVKVYKENFKELQNALKNLKSLRHNFNTMAQQPEKGSMIIWRLS